MTGPKLIEQLLRRWRVQKTVEVVSIALLALAVTSTLQRMVFMPDLMIPVASVTIATGLYWVYSKIATIDSTSIAKHLDRALPETQESSSLLLLPEEDLSMIARIQRGRIDNALSTHTLSGLLPTGPLKRSSLFGAGAVVILASGQLLPTVSNNPSGGPQGPAPIVVNTRTEVSLPSVTDLRINTTPPAYTGLASSMETNRSVSAPEGSRIAWTVTTDISVDSVSIELASGTGLPLNKEGEVWRGHMTLNASQLYHIELASGSGATVSPFYRLTVIPDNPPTIAVTSHQQRTVLPIHGPWIVQVDAVAHDDYAIRGGDIVATVTSGSGESVVFREEVIPLRSSTPGQSSTNLTATLNLGQLGMVMGDELYFYVRVADNRQPEANRARTETFFITIPDTAEVLEVAGMGMAVNPLAESLLSQRQIIIETERLIARRDSTIEKRFNNESNIVGMNQKTVRLRYGQFLGEEDESGNDLAEVHLHDTEVGATTYTPEVRIRLQGALAQMWESELHLRLHSPEEALPYEYRALELLIELQDMRRREFVKRVGFEPAPLRDDARLTGDLADIASRSSQAVVTDIRNGVISDALDILHSLSAGDVPPAAFATLRSTSTVLASEALGSEFDLIPALENLRQLLADLESSAICDSCIAHVERGLWFVLPEGRARPTMSTKRPGTIGQAYLTNLMKRP